MKTTEEIIQTNEFLEGLLDEMVTSFLGQIIE